MRRRRYCFRLVYTCLLIESIHTPNFRVEGACVHPNVHLTLFTVVVCDGDPRVFNGENCAPTSSGDEFVTFLDIQRLVAKFLQRRLA